MLVHLHHKWRRQIVAAFFSLWVAGAALAQTSTITDAESQTGLGGASQIIGTVFGPSGQPLGRRVLIRLSSLTSSDRIFTTNDRGNFAFRGLPTGSYTITIDKEADYKPFSKTVEVIRGTIVDVNIKLEFKDRITTRPAVVNAELLNIPKQALAHYESAIELSKKGNHAEAIDELKAAVAQYPSFTRAFNELGVQYLKLNHLEEADSSFRQALTIDPEFFPGLVNRGITNVMMKRYGEAVPFLRKALVKDEKSAVVHYFLGQALANLGLFDDAERVLLASLKLGRDEVKEAHRILAIIYSSRGDKKQAVDHLEAYLELAPDSPDADSLKEMIRKLKESNN